MIYLLCNIIFKYQKLSQIFSDYSFSIITELYLKSAFEISSISRESKYYPVSLSNIKKGLISSLIPSSSCIE